MLFGGGGGGGYKAVPIIWSPLDPEDIHTHSLEALWKFQGGEEGGLQDQHF